MAAAQLAIPLPCTGSLCHARLLTLTVPVDTCTRLKCTCRWIRNTTSDTRKTDTYSVDFGGCSPAHLVADTVMAATGSKDGCVKVWNVGVRYRQNEDPKCTLTLPAPDQKPVSLVALSRGKSPQFLATFSSSAGLIFWQLPTGNRLQTIAMEDTMQVCVCERERVCVCARLRERASVQCTS